MSDTDQHNAKQESVQLLVLWVVTMVVAIIFITTLSTRTPEKAKEPAEVKHTQAAQKIAPPLDEEQTMAPLPPGHPQINQLQAEVSAPASTTMPELPAGHPPLDAAPAAVAAMPAPAEPTKPMHAPAMHEPPMHAPAEHAKADSHDQHKTHWGYEGKGGPDQWGTMKKEYLACGEGTQQSPININGKNAVAAKVGDITFNYKASPLEIVNNGHTVQVNFTPGSSIQFKGKTFELLQFHFHSPSEHQIDYRYSDMEAHLVHKSADGELAVIGVMLNRGASHPVMDAIWEYFPYEINAPTTIVGATINAADLLPANRNAYYHYMGSLTTPPCSEIVNWIVLQDSINVTEKQVTTFVNALGENNRPVQPMHRRHVVTNAQ